MNSAGPDQTAPKVTVWSGYSQLSAMKGAVWSGHHFIQFWQAFCESNLVENIIFYIIIAYFSQNFTLNEKVWILISRLLLKPTNLDLQFYIIIALHTFSKFYLQLKTVDPD